MSDESPKAPVGTNFVFVDRRRTGRGKSLNNRQKLLKRIKDSIRNAKPEDIDAGGVHKGGSAHGANSYTNPVRVARHALSEPTLHYDPNSGEREIVLIGNDKWLKGDEFPLSKGKGSGGRGRGNGPGEEGEDDFIINISRSEFYDVFFEDCELPDLQETHEKDLPEHVMQRAGFQKVGNPGQLSVIRSFKHSLARRLALTKDSRDEIEELEARIALLMSDGYEHDGDTDSWAKEVYAATRLLQELKAKVASVTMYEDVDLRYRKSERVQVKASDAVLAMLMDISGSMDEDKKRMARKFFTLQYAFIVKKYPQTDLIFIAHTDEAEEMTEEEFFTTRKSGGTIVSPAWELVHKIIKERYDANQTNIYISYAGDGDNWDSDNKLVIDAIEGSGLLSKIRHAVYIQVGQTFSSGYGSGPTLWNVVQSIASGTKKLAMIKISEEAGVFDAFKKIYQKKGSKK